MCAPASTKNEVYTGGENFSTNLKIPLLWRGIKLAIVTPNVIAGRMGSIFGIIEMPTTSKRQLIENPNTLNEKILFLPGVVDSGFFIGMASKAYIGLEDGNVLIIKK